ncbi:MAG: LysR family transcriptional regulator [Firmicutes bacterium]|nr:LysR family transcriptional regulator [Bacillota bacterium]
MNTFQLECFLAVAATFSFAKAAKNLNVSQPTITNQIKSLEEELNVRLFNRTPHMVEITPAGKAFVTDARSILDIAGQAKLRFSVPTEKPIQTISIGCGSYIQLSLLTEVLHRLNSEIANFHPRLFVVPREHLFHLLETDQADVIFDIREGCKLKDNFRFKEVAQSDIVCVCRKDSEFASRESLTIEEVSNETLILCDPMNLSPDISKLQLKLSAGRTIDNTHFSASSEAAIVLAGSGVGTALLPRIYIPNDLHLATVRLEDAPKFSFGMFYKKPFGESLLKKFIDATTEYFNEKQAELTKEIFNDKK